MTLVIIHYHLRPGGVRRVIELAAPFLVREAPVPITRVVLATGEPADRSWHQHFAGQMNGLPVEVLIEPAFHYVSEQRLAPPTIKLRIRRALRALLMNTEGRRATVWVHNPGVGRNFPLIRELSAVCAQRAIPLIAHHHDWWFDNRWGRWPEMRRSGVRSSTSAAQIVFPSHPGVLHVAINQADAAILSAQVGKRALWLPNLSEPTPSPPVPRVREAKRWLYKRLAKDPDPIWLLPCRTLRRKNIAEALLLTRWLRPQAWLVVTGASSSKDEDPYFHALEQAAREHHWRLRLGVLGGDEGSKPSVAELMAACEAVLLTSIQEGFGLPYLEAAAARRPLIARRLPNIAPDLHRFGYRFPQSYDDILISPELFNWRAERARLLRRYDAWKAGVPKFARSQIALPSLLTLEQPLAVAFSRLTLTAQLEILARPALESWQASAPLNPFLDSWRQRATDGTLRITSRPRSAREWLGGKAYGRRLFGALGTLPSSGISQPTAVRIQSEFISAKLDDRNLYPLLWSNRP